MEGNMANKDEKFLNVTLKSEEASDKDEIIISFSGFIKQLRRFLIFWLVLAIIVGILIPVSSAVFTADQHKNLSALVSFNYSGVEKGLAPNGSTFDVNTLKSPIVIEKALTSLNMPLDRLESIRSGITIEGIVPQDAIDRITTYRSIFEQGNLNAGQKMLETAYFPTQFRVTYNYSGSGMKGEDSVEVFNTILNKYSEYFFETYGFAEDEISFTGTLNLKLQDSDTWITVNVNLE